MIDDTGGTCYTFSSSAGTNNQLTGYSYDAAGNMTYDGVHHYTYDAENRITQVDSGSTASYVYNENGKRVRKNTGSSWTEYYYGPNGSVQNEYNGTWPVQYVYAGSQLIAEYTTSTTEFIFADHLGSTRLVTGVNQSVLDSLDYYPYGLQFSGASVTTHKFTGKERDTESGNDYFGARYYASAMGRFMSPDWAAKATPVPYAKLDNPQSLNLYAYVGNNPLSRMDPDGHIDCSGSNAAGAGCQAIAKWNSDHGISPTAPKSNFPGVPVKLPNGNTVPDSHSPTGVLMGPTSSVSDVAAAGKKAGQDAQNWDSQSVGGIVFTVELGKAVGTGGQFDDQRMGPQSDVLTGGFQQLAQFRDVSNFNVGLFSQQAGMTLDQTLQTAGDFAKHFSSNYSPNSPYGLAPQTAEFIRTGWQAGATQF
jgi:RHS repeat-associated protein